MHSNFHPGLANMIIAFAFLGFPLINALYEFIRLKKKSKGSRYAPFYSCISIFPASFFGGLYLGVRYGSLPDSLAYPFFITWRGTTLLSVFVAEISSVLLPLAKSTFSSKIFGLKQRATIIIAACLLTPHVAAIVTGIWQIQKSHSEAVWALPAGCHLISAVFSGIVARKTKWSLAIVCGIHAAVNLVVFGCSVGFLGELLAGKSCPFFELQCTFCIIPVMSKIVLKTFVVPFLKKIEQRKSDIGFPGMSIGKDKVHDSGNNGSRTAEDQSTIVV